MKRFPLIPEQLIEALEERFPDRAPRDVDVTLTQVGVMIGRQEVLDFLRHQHKKQNPLEG